MSDTYFTLLMFLFMAMLGFIFGKSFTEPEDNAHPKKNYERQANTASLKEQN